METPATGKRSAAERYPVLGSLALGFVLLSLCALVAVPILVQRRVDETRTQLEDVVDPARTLVTQLQFSLASEMAALRGYLLTGRPYSIEAYRQGVARERAIYGELRPLAGELGSEVQTRFVEMRTLAEQWHARARVDTLAAPRAAATRDLVETHTEQALFDDAMRRSVALDSAIVRAARQTRGEIRAMERAGLRFTAGLGLLALTSAGVVGWLYLRMRGLARAAEHALAESVRANDSRARLMRGITHDVKNPLGAADGYAQLLELNVRGGLSPDQAELVAGIRRSIGGALAIIADLLDVFRADSGGLSVTRVPAELTEVVGEAVDAHRAAAQAAGLTLAWQPPPDPLRLHTDPARVRQVLGNLLSNAIKYTPVPGRVAVETIEAEGGDDRPGSWALVRVRDTGPGIPPERRDYIFDEFTRLHDGAGVQGHGLGLAISRRIARLLGGEVTLDDGGGEGAQFTLWLPLRAAGTDEQQDAR